MRCPFDVDGLLPEIAGALGAGHEKGERRVGLQAEVQSAERIGQHGRCEVIFKRQGLLADRLGHVHRIVARGHNDFGKGLAPGAVLVHVPLGEKSHRGPGPDQAGEQRKYRERRRREAGERSAVAVLAQLLAAADADDVLGPSGLDCGSGEIEHAGRAAPLPGHGGRIGELGNTQHLDDVGCLEPVSIRDDAVDLLDADAGIGAGRQDRLADELVLGLRRRHAAKPVRRGARTGDRCRSPLH
jgi:hypothetical protein